ARCAAQAVESACALGLLAPSERSAVSARSNCKAILPPGRAGWGFVRVWAIRPAESPQSAARRGSGPGAAGGRALPAVRGGGGGGGGGGGAGDGGVGAGGQREDGAAAVLDR